VDPATGAVIYLGDIDASDSGIIALIPTPPLRARSPGFSSPLAIPTIHGESIDVTDVAGGTATLSANTTISGTVIAGSGISVTGGSFSGVALSQNVSGGGAQSALPTAATASAGSQTAAAAEASSQKAETSDQPATTDPDDDKKRARKHPLLAKYTGRVTVLLPPKP